jgi:hypothetical protein
VTRHAILALKLMSNVLLVRTHSFGSKMMVVYVSVHAQTSTRTTMETLPTEYVNRAAQTATNARVLMDALNAVIINIIRLCYKQI